MLPIDLGHNDSFLNFLLYMYNTKISNGNNSLQKKKNENKNNHPTKYIRIKIDL